MMHRIPDYIAYVRTTPTSERTPDLYEETLNRVAEWVRKNNIKRVVTKNINDWSAEVIKNGDLHQNTVSYTHGCLKRFFKWQMSRGFMRTNPMDSEHLVKVGHITTERTFFTEPQYRKLLDICRRDYHTYWTGAVMVGWNTGLRPSDIAMMQWKSIDAGTETLKLKLWKVRRFEIEVEIPIDGDLFAYLDQWRKNTIYPNNPYVFPDMYQRFIMGEAELTKQFRKLCDAASLPDHSFKGLRHSFISRMVNADVNIHIISAITGLSLKQIATYAHVSLDAKRRALHQAKLHSLFGSQTTPQPQTQPQEKVA